ncbi:5-formyltetrahydrofolate cyclo-ligase, mitochondrial isoform X2 [Olea europaea var. sylvestris]|uniref:5-formyltetrahydrofolate cyclo-ligase, mitochondrial isoform X2 n=1 Tax=Olea europaea var. sylvestris TaxID=158386 RepID=UPI000C1CCF3F|nr:5-formyltetrahydrofolate cyclo-ligase, mitochondrial isoform X2 [Olea europaea var. sylvestris]
MTIIWLTKRAREWIVAAERLMIHPRTLATAAASPPSFLTTRVLYPYSSRLNLRQTAILNFTTMNTNNAQLDTIFKQKKILRSKVRKDLKSMDPTLRSQEDDAIQSIILEAPWFKSCKGLCAYISCSALREVDTSKVLSEILKNTDQDDHSQVSKKLYVPRVEDKNSHMRMLNISSMNDLIANSMDILEPAPVDAKGNERQDGLAFDKSGRRLGRGGGYYDTFLTKYEELAKDRKWKRPLFVALSYSQQILDENIIPMTPNDVLVDALVSSSGVIPISSAAQAMYS